MKNSRLQDFNNGITESLATSLVMDAMKTLHSSVKYSVRQNSQSDIYEDLKRIRISRNYNSFAKNQSKKRRNAQLVTALKLVLEKVLEEYGDIFSDEEIALKQQILELDLEPTMNQRFAKNTRGEYYELIENEYVKRDEIVEVKDNGNFVVCDTNRISGLNFYIEYGENNKPVSYQFFASKRLVSSSRELVATTFALKKEFVKRYKLKGFAGGSGNFCKRVMNAFSPLHTSGYYMDANYNFFKWNSKTLKFEIQYRTGTTLGAPSIADYEIYVDKIVRTDYDGCVA